MRPNQPSHNGGLKVCFAWAALLPTALLGISKQNFRFQLEMPMNRATLGT
jgi:hypothetical protein